MIRADIDDLINFLDALAKADPVAMGALVTHRVPCNQEIAEHSNVQSGDNPLCLGMLGVLNGYGGRIEEGRFKGWGMIAAVMTLDGRCEGFVRTDEWLSLDVEKVPPP